MEEPVPQGQQMLFDEDGYNPYLPENMKMAFDSLKSKLYQTFPGARTTTENVELDFTPNKKYVRFLPSDSTQFEALMSEDLALFDYPLDKPVVQEGEYVSEPANEAGFNWLYGVVPINFDFPPVDHEVIDEIFIPKFSADDETDGHSSGSAANDPTEIKGMLMGAELYSLYLSRHLSEEEADELLAMLKGEVPIGERLDDSAWDRFVNRLKSVRNAIGSIFVAPAYAKKANPLNWCWGCVFNSSWTPSGSVRVRDGNLNQPIRGVKVVIHRGLKMVGVYTNDNGNFSSWAKFGSNVTYTVHWRNRSSRAWGNLYFRFVDKWYLTTAKHDIRKNTRSRVDYTYALVGERPTHENAALAMIYLAAQHNYHKYILGLKRPEKNLRIRIRQAENSSTGQERAFNNHINIGSQLHMWIKEPGGRYKTGRDLVATTFHEIAHYTHYHEIRDWPFPASQYEWTRIDCGIKESWATCVEHYLTRATYYPDFDEQYASQLEFNDVSEYNGIFIDIIDNDNQWARLGGNRPNDRVSGYTIAQVESAVYGNNNNLFSEILGELADRDHATSGFIDDLYEQYRNNVSYDCSPFFEREWD